MLILTWTGDKSGLVSWLLVLFFRNIARLNFIDVVTQEATNGDGDGDANWLWILAGPIVDCLSAAADGSGKSRPLQRPEEHVQPADTQW